MDTETSSLSLLVRLIRAHVVSDFVIQPTSWITQSVRRGGDPSASICTG
jgi:hypothetical protein